jgi:hypothetical protein
VFALGAGQVVFRLSTAWRDGTTHLLILPLEFIQRQAAQADRPYPAGWLACTCH